jgi:hypothetical protein
VVHHEVVSKASLCVVRPCVHGAGREPAVLRPEVPSTRKSSGRAGCKASLGASRPTYRGEHQTGVRTSQSIVANDDGNAEAMTFAIDYNWPEEELRLIAEKFVRPPMAIFHDYITALKQVIGKGTILRDFIRQNPDIRLSVSPSVIESINVVANSIISGGARGNVERMRIKPMPASYAKANDELEARQHPECSKRAMDSIREALLGPEPPKSPLRRL